MRAVKPLAQEGTESLRPKLLGIAYRMLGSAADAEDAVQDAYVRHQQAVGVDDSEAWLVKVTTRLCIDRLRQLKRREQYVGPWLPEPVTEDWNGEAGSRLELSESLSIAFMVLLETLSPAERAAYLLREAFGYEFDEIAELLDKSPVNVRQIMVRAKLRLDAGERRFRPTRSEVEALSERFLSACQSGDLETIESLLAKDVVYSADGGGKVFAAPQPIVGRQRVAKLLSVVFRKLEAVCDVRLTSVNGQPGIVFSHAGRTVDVMAFDPAGEQIDAIYAVINPDKLGLWHTADADADVTIQSLFKKP